MENTAKVEGQGSHEPNTENELQNEPGEIAPAEEESMAAMEEKQGEQDQGALADEEDDEEDI